MTTKKNTYKIELLPSNISGAKDTMLRGGLAHKVREPRTLELTDEQVEVFNNDWRFKVEDSTDTAETLEDGTLAESQAIPSAGELAGEEAAEIKTETLADTDATQAEEAGLETEGTLNVEELLKAHSRDELDDLAFELGVESPEKLDNKTEVAQAIVDAQ